MDRNSLLTVAVILAIALGGTYYYKTGRSFSSIFGSNSPNESWKENDPGWEKMKSDPPPQQPAEPPQKMPEQEKQQEKQRDRALPMQPQQKQGGC